MISNIVLRGFQPHANTTLLLDKVTTLVGESDVGKSSIIRALYWLCLGKPSGVKFITKGKDKCRVEVWLDNGVKVTRLRGRKTPTKYKLIVPVGDGKFLEKVYKAMGNDVPSPIINALGVEEINFQLQLDPPLWMLESAGQVSKNLNRIINLEAVDKSLKLIGDKVRKAKSTLQVCQDRLAANREKVKDLAWVEEMASEHAELSEKRAERDTLKNRLSGLSLSLGRVQALRTQRLSLQASLEHATAYAKAMREAHKATQELKARRAELGSKLGRLEVLCNSIRDYTCWEVDLHNALGIEIRKLEAVKSCPLCGRPIRSQSSAPTCTSHTKRRRPGRSVGRSGMK